MAINKAEHLWKLSVLSPHALKADPRFQPRIGLHEATVSRYAAAMCRGDSFPPIKAAALGKGQLYVIDGFHRLEAALRSSQLSIPVHIAKMTEADAVAYALDANTTHGLPLARADKRNIFNRYVAMGFHLEPSGRVKSLRTIRSDLAGIAWPNTIARWLKDANVQPSDHEDLPPFRPAQGDGEEGHLEDPEDMEALNSFDHHRLELERLYATMSNAAAMLQARETLRQLLARLDGDKRLDGLDI